jgi:hypothetical protein
MDEHRLVTQRYIRLKRLDVKGGAPGFFPIAVPSNRSRQSRGNLAELVLGEGAKGLGAGIA